MTLALPVRTPAPAELTTLRRARLTSAEGRWGREGVWCTPCRRSTPVTQLHVLPGRSVLRCESCAGDLLVLPRAHRLRSRLH